jgi:hypothetical protein
MGVFVLVTGVSAQRTALPMRAPAMPTGSVDLGALPASQPMKLTLYLSPSAERQAALVNFLKNLQTPGSVTYHAWLTPAQFGQQFGADTDQLAAVNAFAQASGLSVESASASGLRVVVSGSAAQVEATFAPSLHAFRVADKIHFANTASASLPMSLASNIVAVGGLSDIPSAQPMTLATDGAANAVAAQDALKAIADTAEANTARLLTLSTASCLEDIDAASQSAMQLALRQASAQGIIILAATGCGSRGSAGFPSILSEATSVAIAPGITPPATANLIEARPSWQLAIGLPADALRHEPDLTTSSLSAFAQAMMTILTKQPAPSGGSAPRLGNINATLYQLASEPGLYTQPDNAAAGTWEASTGLGLVDLQKLIKLFPNGSLNDNVSLTVSNGGFVAHGQSLTFSSTVTDTSGQGGGAVPGGSVVFSTTSGVALGTGTLSGGSTSVTYNQLPAGSYTAQAQYSGDGTYSPNQSVTDGFAVGAEQAQMTAVAGSGSVGGTLSITVTERSTSGIGTPSGTVTVAPQGTSDTTQYSGTLSGSGGTATAIVTVAAVQGGADAFNVTCASDPSFTCSTVQSVTAQVSVGTPTMTLTANPISPGAGQTVTLTAVVAGKGGLYPVPAGNVDFFDNGAKLGPATLNNGTANFTSQPLTGTSHSFSATYDGNNNYGTVSAQAGASNSSASATTVQLNISPSVPSAGSTTSLTATIGYTLTNGATPSSTVSFFEDGALLATEAVSNGQAQLTSTGLSSTTTHQYYVVYNGDANYQPSTSIVTTTPASGTSTVPTITTMTVNPNPPVAANTTTLTATVAPTTGSGSPTGTVSFYEDNALITSAPVSGGIAVYSSAGISGTSAHTFYAIYSGDPTYLTSTSATVTTAATGASPTTTALTVDPNPPVSGSNTTLTATISYTLNNAVPSGTVTFYEDNVVLGTGLVSNTTATATFNSSSLNSTTIHDFYAVYSGDSNYGPSTAPGVSTSASSATNTTSTVLVVNPNPPVSGNLTTLTATISDSASGIAPTGFVEFYEDGTYLTEEPVSGNVATLSSTVFSSTASHTFYAVYTGDTNFKVSTSPTVSTAVSTSTVTTTLALNVNPNPPVSGSVTTLTATVSQTGSTSRPSGTVNFYEDNALLGSMPLTSSTGTATLSTTALSGTIAHTFFAVYSGDPIFKASTAPTVTTAATSTKATTTTIVSAASGSVPVGGTVALTGTITPSSIVNSTPPTGTITFSSAQGTLCVAGVGSNTGSCTATLTTSGTQSIIATYSGDNNYSGSVSAAAATVTVGATSAGGVLIAAVSPSSSIMYGGTVTLSSTLTPTTAVTGGPAGTITFALSGTVTAAFTTALISNGSTSASATDAIPTPVPGTYIVTATCASTNVTCTGLSATASLTVIKGNTVTTLVASPTSPLAGQTTTFTATVAPATTPNPSALAPTGTVMFFVNGVATPESVINGVATFNTVLTATTGNFVTAVYSGDTNWNGSSSSQLDVIIAPIPTTSSMTANETTALYTANIVLTDAVIVAPTTLTPFPPAPIGTVTFYDLYNGQTTLLGTASLTTVVPGDSIAQLSTTGLLKGTHLITALFNANTTFASSSATITINITDYTVAFSPQTLNLSRGTGGSAIATITPFNGFAGQVVLGCTPPPGTGITCSFAPTVIDVGGTSVLSITTTAATASITHPAMGKGATAITLATVSLGTLLFGLLLPRKRRLPAVFLALLAALAVGGSMGCTTQGILNTQSTSGSGGSGGSGTPLGTQLLSITTQGTDGITTVRHDTQYQVTVQ